MSEVKYKQFKCIVIDSTLDPEDTTMLAATMKTARCRIDLSSIISYQESSTIFVGYDGPFDCCFVDIKGGEPIVVAMLYDELDALMKKVYPERFAL